MLTRVQSSAQALAGQGRSRGRGEELHHLFILHQRHYQNVVVFYFIDVLRLQMTFFVRQSPVRYQVTVTCVDVPCDV
jgi:hypothetical protein